MRNGAAVEIQTLQKCLTFPETGTSQQLMAKCATITIIVVCLQILSEAFASDKNFTHHAAYLLHSYKC